MRLDGPSEKMQRNYALMRLAFFYFTSDIFVIYLLIREKLFGKKNRWEGAKLSSSLHAEKN